MKTRLMAGAFLICHGKVLLLHRSEKKKIAPGLWSCVGGHLEPEELNAPLTACYREIEEETGIPPSQILCLRLRYIYVRKTEDEIRTVFYFAGELKSEIPLPPCGEGALHWVSLADMLLKPMSFSVKQITNHLAENLLDEHVWLCGVNAENTEMTWMSLS